MPQRGIRDLTVAESLGVRVAALQMSGAVRFVVNGPTMTTYGLFGTLRAMISFDPSEINNWSDKPDAPHRLPELIGQLILATVPMPSSIDMPGGSSVNAPGWDGLLVSDHGNARVPSNGTT